NFFFLLYGPNRKAGGAGGENAANYDNPDFNRLFDEMKTMTDSPERRRIISQMTGVVRQDAPWHWGYYPVRFALKHAWLGNVKPNVLVNNEKKYYRIKPELRVKNRAEWNRPILWPIGVGLALVAFLSILGLLISRRRSVNSR
ncbi:MAG: peptide ABC transporter substrate-binding protein, partial [Spirochaetia bacterium]|nr:peptide ABC transporter substrate-binding protein [Spirochaetia bacterium]